MEAISTYNLELPAQAASSGAARGIVATAARKLTCMSESDIEDLCVAVGEAFANVVRHGAPSDQDPVRLAVEHREDRLVVHLVYRSDPFDTMPLPPAPEDLAGGGYGLFIMRTLADVVDFTFRDGATHLCLQKRCRALTSASPSQGGAWGACSDVPLKPSIH